MAAWDFGIPMLVKVPKPEVNTDSPSSRTKRKHSGRHFNMPLPFALQKFFIIIFPLFTIANYVNMCYY